MPADGGMIRFVARAALVSSAVNIAESPGDPLLTTSPSVVSRMSTRKRYGPVAHEAVKQ